MDFIKGNEQVRIDPNGIDISGAGNIFIDSNSITGDISFNDKVSLSNNFDVTGKTDFTGDVSLNGNINISGNNNFVITNNGNVGIGTSIPNAKLEIGASTSNPSSIISDIENGVAIAHPTPTSDTAINDPKTTLYLGRSGTASISNPVGAFFKICRYENSGVNSKTRLDIDLRSNYSVVEKIMTLLDNGSVGIGTTSPTEKLEISDGNILLTGITNYSYGQDTPLIPETPLSIKFKKDTDCQYSGYSGGIVAKISAVYDNQDFSSGSNALAFYTYTGRQSTSDNTVERMRISGSGYVGIGTSDPKYPLHITKAGSNYWNYINNSLYEDGSVVHSVSNHQPLTSAYFEDNIVATTFGAKSDRRIKTDISLISDDTALNLVNALESYEYHYIDPERKQPMKTIGFIAQEVNNVVPNAVSIQTDYIPDEMRMITDQQWTQDASNNWLLEIPDLDMSSNFTGKAKFYVSNDPSGNDEVCKEVVIKEILTEDSTPLFPKTKLVAEFDQSWNNVFFYGKEVNDFHTIDKNQIFALHHSAIQELSRKNDEKTQKITGLENKVNNMVVTNAVLKSTNENLKSRLEALETIVAGLQNN